MDVLLPVELNEELLSSKVHCCFHWSMLIAWSSLGCYELLDAGLETSVKEDTLCTISKVQ